VAGKYGGRKFGKNCRKCHVFLAWTFKYIDEKTREIGLGGKK